MRDNRNKFRKGKILSILEGRNDFLTAKEIYVLLKEKFKYSDGITSSISLSLVLKGFPEIEKKKKGRIWIYKLKD